MPLQLISSNRVETLQQHLAGRLSAEPMHNPFAREVIVVPGMAMARWLNLRLAQDLGVAANIAYPLPAAWIWELAGSLLPDVPERDPLDRESAAWRIYRLLPQHMPDPAFATLRQYLADDSDGIRRWQLSVRIADVFDRYQFYRPDWLRSWADGQSVAAAADWQAQLWRSLTADLADRHRVALVERLVRALEGPVDAAKLPARVSLFALSTLPPLFIDVLRALAKHCAVTLYQHSPTDHYWADLVSEKQAARRRLHNASHDLYCETGNELLASWGKQGQAFQDLLLEGGLAEAGHEEIYVAPEADALLHRLQRDFLTLDGETLPVEADASIRVAVCHSPLRECQALHDHLLRELQRDPDLKPEDILVMVPEISRYAPYIEAVFRRDESDNRPFLPWNLSDLTLVDEHPLTLTFFELLRLPGSRFGFSGIMSILEVPEIARHHGLSQQDIDGLYSIFQQARVRWGLDAGHKQRLGLPATAGNTWQQAEQRLLAGYAMGGDEGSTDGLWQSIAVMPHQGQADAGAMGRFFRFLDRLRYWQSELDRSRSAEDWQIAINALIEDFFPEYGDEDDRLQQIRDVLELLARQAGSTELSLPLLTLWLENSLGNHSQRGRYFSGGITFCGMKPMRSMPFRVICVLGMNDQAFPRRDRPVEFDGMAQQWRPGDPRKGDEDRYLLLETLLCARDRLYFSYTGRSLKNNEPLQPSVLLRELMDYLDSRYGRDRSGISKALTVELPMQAFSARNYMDDPRSHDRLWCHVARSVHAQNRGGGSKAWPSENLPLHADETEPVISLSSLIRFLQHPVRFFMQQRFRIYLEGIDEVDDDEFFDLAGLQGWQVRQRMIEDTLQGRGTPLDVLAAEGLLPHGVIAPISRQDIEEQAQPLLQQIAGYADFEPVPQPVCMEIGEGNVLEGSIQGYRPGVGLVQVLASNCKGKHLLSLWVEHLALCAGSLLPNGELSQLFSRDMHVQLVPMAEADAMAQLASLTALYREGLQRPLPVAPAASFVLAKALYKGKSETEALKSAWSSWDNSYNSAADGDSSDDYLLLVLQTGIQPPLESPEFSDVARTLYEQFLQEAKL